MNTNVEQLQEDLKNDLQDIYLGNLGTVDTNLILPKEGKRGSQFSWHSNEILFISHEGEVTQPTYGVGNREVILTVTATNGTQKQTKEYVVTVLEEVPTTEIVEVYDLEKTINRALKGQLPSVCVVKLNDGTFSTEPVTWANTIDWSKDRQVIQGQVGMSDFTVQCTVLLEEAYLEQPTKKRYSLAARLTGDSIFKEASDRMLVHLAQVDCNQLLFSFRETAQLSVEGATQMTGWDAPECNLRGHTTGHYLSAFSLASFVTGKEIYQEKVNYLISELGKCQTALTNLGMNEGFLSAYDEKQFDLLEVYTKYPEIWAPYYTLDKLLNGLLDGYEFTNNQQGLEIAKKIGDWTYNRLSKLTDKQLKKMWSIYIAGEFGGMISALIRLYHFTQDNHYLNTALLFENDKLYVPMAANYDTLNGVHANQHIPQIIGALDIYEETGEATYHEIAQNFWEIVVRHHTYANGGLGETEMFKKADQTAQFLTHKTAESCASYNMLKLSKKLYDLDPQNFYFDYYENALHNHLLAAASHDCDGGTTYFLPLAPAGEKHFDTHENTCCHGSGLETLLRFQKDIYSFDSECCYVNLYYPSEVDWSEKKVTIRQENENNKIKLFVDGQGQFPIEFRVPSWMNLMEVQVDEQVVTSTIEDGYLHVQSDWNDSSITITYENKTQVKETSDNPAIFALFYGREMLTVCSDQPNYLSFSKGILAEGIRDEEGYYLGDQQMKPINQINHETYHGYFKIE
ncbi:hypothetical protein BAU15_01295 [Enterococcus sp. JM4C]|uniref:beta-L-arabinofuranosidase domain-containing protein n=1 Tax=Candidatus Enterococcus huntleyi TaxID=1857217 RepID=UPI00137B0139|nr:beta-L-arabinofuranosidase domain-containing protein [Enterococcus sp. JM4C]KAF1299310.1 hypothetical protein BAU15_01295 [Enterococcus sp. JM4C]